MTALSLAPATPSAADHEKFQTNTKASETLDMDLMARRNALMDRYPVSESELDHLLSIDLAKVLDSGSSLESLACILPISYPKNEDRIKLIASIEQDLLPELSRIFQKECQDVFVVGISSQDEPELHAQSKVVEATIHLTGRRGSPRMSDKIYSSLASKDGTNVSVARLADFVHRLARAADRLDHDNNDDDDDDDCLPSSQVVPTAWAFSIASASQDLSATAVNRLEWNYWIENTAPEVPHLLATVFSHILFPSREETCPLFPWVSGPITDNGHQKQSLTGFWRHRSDTIPLQLSFMGLGGPWVQEPRRLYSSDENGLAFATFAAALLAFAGPTMALIRTTAGEILGFYTEVAWKKGPDWYTATDRDGQQAVNDHLDLSTSILFQLQPSWNVYNLMETSNNDGNASDGEPPWAKKKRKVFHQYLHTPVSYHRSKGRLEGLAMGGVAADAPRLHITTSLENCKAGCMDQTFQAGPLLGGNNGNDKQEQEQQNNMFFDVDALEVWAIRSQDFQEALAAGKLRASIRESTRRHMAQVDRMQFLDDFSSGAFMNSSYHHREWTRGRAEYECKVKEGEE